MARGNGKFSKALSAQAFPEPAGQPVESIPATDVADRAFKYNPDKRMFERTEAEKKATLEAALQVADDNELFDNLVGFLKNITLHQRLLDNKEARDRIKTTFEALPESVRKAIEPTQDVVDLLYRGGSHATRPAKSGTTNAGFSTNQGTYTGYGSQIYSKSDMLSHGVVISYQKAWDLAEAVDRVLDERRLAGLPISNDRRTSGELAKGKDKQGYDHSLSVKRRFPAEDEHLITDIKWRSDAEQRAIERGGRYKSQKSKDAKDEAANYLDL